MRKFPFFIKDMKEAALAAALLDEFNGELPADHPFLYHLRCHTMPVLVAGRVLFRGRPLWNRDGKAIQDVDSGSFEVLGERFFRDKHRVYVQGQLGSDTAYEYFYSIDGAHLGSFQVLNERYAKDARRAYYVTETVITSPSLAAFRAVPMVFLPFTRKLYDCTQGCKFAIDDHHV